MIDAVPPRKCAVTTASASQVRQDFTETLNRVAYQDESVVIERRGRPLAVLISYEDFRLFEHLVLREDL